MKLTIITADIKGKRGEFSCSGWMSLKIHSGQWQLLTSLTYIACALGRQDLGTRTEEMGGQAAHLLADNKKKSQKQKFVFSASGRTVRMLMHGH